MLDQPDRPRKADPRPADQKNGDVGTRRGPLDVPRERTADSPTDDVHARIAGGRYRLLVFHGGAPPLQFWQALDTALDRQVALTFVDPDRALPDEVLQEILSRTLRLSRIDKPGIARVLDVVHTGSGGLVVSEWIRGGSLQEVADTAPSPVGAVRASRRRGAPRRRRPVDRSPEPGAGQHRRRRGAGLPGDHARRQPAGRHPRHRGRAVCAAGQSVAAGRERGAQRARTGRTRLLGQPRRTDGHRPRHSLPDLRGRRPGGPG